MIEITELLRSYVSGVRRVIGAGCVSLYVPAVLSGRSRPSLIHDGPLHPVPELTSLDSAMSFAAGQQTHVDAEATAGGLIVERSQDVDAGLLRLCSPPSGSAKTVSGRRRRRDSAAGPALLADAWLGVRFGPGEGPVADRLVGIIGRSPTAVDADGGPWEWLLSIGGFLAGHAAQLSAFLRDPVTGFANRAGFTEIVTEELEGARLNSNRLALLLVNPDGFAAINERFGREAGDLIVSEMSRRLRDSLRASDTISRYGGVIFAVTLVDSSLERARAVANTLRQRLAEGAFLDGAVRIGFSVGVAIFEPGDDAILTPLDLVRRADQALNLAKRQGGGRVADWEDRAGAEEEGNIDRLHGIFTGNMSKDYRNMVLLSDTLAAIAVSQDFEKVAAEVVESLDGSLRPEHLALFSVLDEGEMRLLHGLTKHEPGDGGTQTRIETVELGREEMDLVMAAVKSGEPQETCRSLGPPKGSDSPEVRCYAIPLIAAEQCVGCLYLDGRGDSFQLERSDLIFLSALAAQLAVAMDRARLRELERQRQERERRRLQAELNELRHAVQQARLVYRSPEMDSVLAIARRVAPTDATVLIVGESGTGKELLASTIHELSPRNKKPLVIVDCGSIAISLIESELFGHEKGAFTGAQLRRTGRLAEAAGGTVLLDEIGELPLEVQSKLLRFVQEKQFMAVGGTRQQAVDVRILAATNRDLSEEVAAGRFREDLYYRLNVVCLDIPPLRARRDDILYLARHYLETYVVQYQKNLRLTADGEAALLEHSWPGNVRELQNRMMQAVILSEGGEVGPRELKLPPATRGGVAIPQFRSNESSVAVSAGRGAPSGLIGRDEAPSSSSAAVSGVDAWTELGLVLGEQIEAVLSGGQVAIPVGRWMGEDLVLEAAAACYDNGRQAAALVGLPGTTYRRRLQKATEHTWAGEAARPGQWEPMKEILKRIVAAPRENGEDLLSLAEQVLLGEILSRYPRNVRTGATLLGVSQPTYRRRAAAFRAGEETEHRSDA